jgi:hydroxymethylpyrimidine pyrophosphatase-like HAD family hydrolase
MRYLALATDYDGTIAEDGVVDKSTLAALEKLRGGSRRLILVTGRDLTDIQRAMPRLDLFDFVVAENGALLYDPTSHEEQALGVAPPQAFLERLGELGVAPLWIGRVIVATWERNEGKVLRAIRDLGLNLQITLNKTAVMVLPAGITKASGLRAALARLGLSPLNCVGVGDAENDLAFLDICGMPVAVANAVPAVKERAAFVTTGARGAGVTELIEQFFATDLTEFDATGEPGRALLVADDDRGASRDLP